MYVTCAAVAHGVGPGTTLTLESRQHDADGKADQLVALKCMVEPGGAARRLPLVFDRLVEEKNCYLITRLLLT